MLRDTLSDLSHRTTLIDGLGHDRLAHSPRVLAQLEASFHLQPNSLRVDLSSAYQSPLVASPSFPVSILVPTMARKVSTVDANMHNWSGAFEPTLAGTDRAPSNIAGLLNSGVVNPEELEGGLLEKEVEPWAGDFLNGGTRLFEATDTGAATRAEPMKRCVPELSIWSPNFHKQVEFGSKDDGKLMENPPVGKSPAHAYQLPSLSCLEADCRGALSSYSSNQRTHGPEKDFYGTRIRSATCTFLNLLSASRASPDTASPTSSDSHGSERSILPPVGYSPSSLAEDVVSFLESESPSTLSPLDTRGDPLTMQEEDSSQELARTLAGVNLESGLSEVIPRRGADRASGEERRNILENASDDHFVDEHGYINSQYAFLRRKEMELVVRSSFLDGSGRHGAITAASRTALLGWMKSLHKAAPTVHRNGSKLAPETLFLAANVLDRFLSIPSARGVLLGGGARELELTAVSALSLASKFEDVEVPSLWAFAAASELVAGDRSDRGSGNADLTAGCKWIPGGASSVKCSCSCRVCEVRREVRRIEQVITSALGFRIMAPTALSFLGIYLARAQRLGHVGPSEVMEKVRSEATDMLWAVVRDASSLDYRPSDLAATALYLASLNTSPSKLLWFQLMAITGTELKHLQGCLRNTRRVKAAASRLKHEVTESNSQRSFFRGRSLASVGVAAGDRFVDSVLRVGGVDGGGAFRADELEVPEIEVRGGFVDSVLRLGGVEAETGLGGGAARGGGRCLSVVDVGDSFVDSVLRLGGLETARGLRGVREENRWDAFGGGGRGALPSGGVESDVSCDLCSGRSSCTASVPVVMGGSFA